MPLELICRRCGAAFVPTKRDVLRGPAVYRYCEACRTPPATSGVPIAGPVPA